MGSAQPMPTPMSDSYSRPQTRESVESAKKGLEYESFEYESRLDTALVIQSSKRTKTRAGHQADCILVAVKVLWVASVVPVPRSHTRLPQVPRPHPTVPLHPGHRVTTVL